MMTSRRGFTFVEVMITTALISIVIGTLATLYFYAFTRTTRGVTEVAAVLQIQGLLDRMDNQIAQACDVSIVTSGPGIGLKCTMPLSGTDKDGDGVLDTYVPNSVSRRQIAKYTRGKRVWYYMAAAPGNFGTAGSIFYQAVRNDDALPTSANVVNTFSYAPGDVYRWSLLDSVAFAIDGTNESVTVSARTSTLARAERSAGVATVEAGDNYVVNVTRKTCWRNWWK